MLELVQTVVKVLYIRRCVECGPLCWLKGMEEPEDQRAK